MCPRRNFWAYLASFTYARRDKNGLRRFPQAIAHRGYKAKHPENTMAAFVGAVDAGAHAVESDIHLSKDNVVVLSHVSRRLLLRPHQQAACLCD